MSETTQPVDTQAESSLGLTDLALMANIIQVTTQRGAIKAEEMETVGALYKKLAAFVNANAPAVNSEDDAENINQETEEDQ